MSATVIRMSAIGTWAMILLVVAGAAPAAQRNDPGDSPLARAVSAAYEDNRSKFSRGTIQFTYSDGICDDSRLARLGMLKDQYTTTGSASLDGKRAAYARVFPIEVMESATRRISGRQTSSRILSVKCATDGAVSLMVDINPAFEEKQRITLSGQIVPGSQEFYRQAQLPLSIGAGMEDRFDASSLLRRALSGSPGHRVLIVEDEEFEGVRLVKAKIEHSNGVATIWYDVERGAIPRRCRFEGKRGTIAEQFHDDLRQIPGVGWYPFVMTMILGGNRVQRLELTNAEFTKRPVDSDFRLTFDEPVEVSDSVNGLTYARRSSWELSALPSRGSSGVVRYDPSPRPAPVPLPGERAAPSVIGQLINGAVVMSVLVVAWWALSRVRARLTK